jgi:hypothetical protein
MWSKRERRSTQSVGKSLVKDFNPSREVLWRIGVTSWGILMLTSTNTTIAIEDLVVSGVEHSHNQCHTDSQWDYLTCGFDGIDAGDIVPS